MHDNARYVKSVHFSSLRPLRNPRPKRAVSTAYQALRACTQVLTSLDRAGAR